MQSLPIHYSYGLVIVSISIAILAAYAAFSLADRVRLATSTGQRLFWLLGGSSAMGVGIWSMHYLGMLAVKMPVQTFYHFPTVLLSMVLAVVASAVALMVVSSERLNWMGLLAGGVLMGSGIGGMHYVGMAAMRSSATRHYSIPLVLLSVVVAVIAATLALWIGFVVRSRETRVGPLRVAGATVMGLGISAMHYTAMQAVCFMPGNMAYSRADSVHVSVLGETAICVVAGFILLTALTTAAFEKRRFRALHEAHQRLEASQQKLIDAERDLREANSLLNELSIRDGLTGLYNRRHFDATVDTEWRRARRTGSWMSLLMVDADCFKAMNDNYGHQRGDDCLRDIARVLESQPRRSYDVAARYGGEEFAIVLPGATPSGALSVAEAIRREVQALNIEHAYSPAGVLTVSIGVCSRQPEVDEDVDVLVREADTALYMAKQLGRNRVEVASSIAVEV